MIELPRSNGWGATCHTTPGPVSCSRSATLSRASRRSLMRCAPLKQRYVSVPPPHGLGETLCSNAIVLA